MFLQPAAELRTDDIIGLALKFLMLDRNAIHGDALTQFQRQHLLPFLR